MFAPLITITSANIRGAQPGVAAQAEPGETSFHD
jgi:hypothetical protein